VGSTRSNELGKEVAAGAKERKRKLFKIARLAKKDDE